MIESVFRYFDALEADFQRYYGLDLRDAIWGENAMGARRFMALVQWLPKDAAFFRAQNPSWEWDQDTELLAELIEVMDVGNRMYYEANTDKTAKQMKPVKIQRPWDTPKEKVPTDAALRSIGNLGVKYTPSKAANN